MKRLFLIPLLSALLGAAIVVGVLAAVGDLKPAKERVVTEVQSLPATTSSSNTSQSGSGLTAHDIYERVAPAVAYVTSSIVKKVESPFDPFGGQEAQKGTATGSGILISKEGLILTNWHVVAEAVKVHVKFSEEGEGVEATVVGDNPSQDLALLRVPASAVSKIKPVTLGDSSKVQVGEPVLAIGNPFALARTLTTGIVSALQRRIVAPNGFAIENAIQTDAPINPGNSGGPLLNASGEVIGINSQIETGGSGSDGNIGIGFAVPINTAKEELPRLEKGGAIKTAYLGVSTVTVDNALSALNLPVHEGALIQEVKPNTPAAKAGLKAGNLEVHTSEGEAIVAGGDIIVGIDGKKVSSSNDLASAIEAKEPGDKVTIEFEHPNASGKYEKKSADVTLTTRPAKIANPSTPEG